jgi:hypothetical protein
MSESQSGSALQLILLSGLLVAYLVWLYRDSKSRGMSFVAALVLGGFYFFKRGPKVAFTSCYKCGKTRQAASSVCEHCGAVGSAPKADNPYA